MSCFVIVQLYIDKLHDMNYQFKRTVDIHIQINIHQLADNIFLWRTTQNSQLTNNNYNQDYVY